MNKKDLIAEVVEATGEKKSVVERVVNSVFATMGATLAKGENIQLLGFGTFDIRQRAEREGRNPHTGEPMKIAACKTISFKASKNIKVALNR